MGLAEQSGVCESEKQNNELKETIRLHTDEGIIIKSGDNYLWVHHYTHILIWYVVIFYILAKL